MIREGLSEKLVAECHMKLEGESIPGRGTAAGAKALRWAPVWHVGSTGRPVQLDNGEAKG